MGCQKIIEKIDNTLKQYVCTYVGNGNHWPFLTRKAKRPKSPRHNFRLPSRIHILISIYFFDTKKGSQFVVHRRPLESWKVNGTFWRESRRPSGSIYSCHAPHNMYAHGALNKTCIPRKKGHTKNPLRVSSILRIFFNNFFVPMSFTPIFYLLQTCMHVIKDHWDRSRYRLRRYGFGRKCVSLIT
jgi:hypothetical protein